MSGGATDRGGIGSDATDDDLAAVAVVRTSGRGRAVVAFRGFAEGELVLSCPVIVFGADQAEAFEQTVLEPIPYRWSQAPADLAAGPPANHWSHAGREPGALVLGLGTFVNHSFRPSCTYRRDFAGQTLDFVACRPIAPGEEITVNYNGALAPDAPMWFALDARDEAASYDVAVLPRPRVRTRVGTSPGRGRGVFAACDIRIHEVIERAPVIVLPQPDYDLLDARTTLADYHFPWDRRTHSGALVLGYGSLYNHSFAANADYVRDHDSEEVVFFALRDIVAGEEIRWNYRNGPSSDGPMWFDLAPEEDDSAASTMPPMSAS